MGSPAGQQAPWPLPLTASSPRPAFNPPPPTHTHAPAPPPPPGRDLKLDNTILDQREPPRLKLCDFGYANSWGESAGGHMDTLRIGTKEYMGPELTRSKWVAGRGRGAGRPGLGRLGQAWAGLTWCAASCCRGGVPSFHAA
jgi:hypothetical protein